jgi:L-2-hydroxyglutarate oxidase LhgO
MDYQTDAVVVGAGVIGLAVGRALAQAGLETLILERGPLVGEQTSSRNSEVIHAGIYYPPGSLKADSCVRGKDLLYDFLHSHKVPHRRCGKLVVARNAKAEPALITIRERAERCGVADLELLGESDIRAMEPEVAAERGLFSPSTGIVDSHQLMLALQGDFEAAGGLLALSSPLEGGSLACGGLHRIHIGGEAPTDIGCRLLVNAAGLYARQVWDTLVGGSTRSSAPPQYYAKGHYYSYPGAAPFSRLVYPLPVAGGLGIHATVDLGGQLRFGPDVRWVDAVDYSFDDSGRAAFTEAIRDYFPGLDAGRLQPGYTGIRPKVVGPGDPAGDFTLLTSEHHAIEGFVSLHGIESPGLTACLAIAENVANALVR